MSESRSLIPRGTRPHAGTRRARVCVGAALIFFFVLVFGVRPARSDAQRLPSSSFGPSVIVETAQAPASTSEPKSAAGTLSPAQAIVLGVIEGVTEFLPISSTGHLVVAEKLMGVGTTDSTKDAADAYSIVIQAGAILAIVFLYYRRLISVAKGVVGRDDDGRKVGISLVVAFLPAAIVGFIFDKTIKAHLLAPAPVVAAWILGGVVLLVLSSSGWLEREKEGADLVSLSIRSALIIGGAQCLALWPGTSRSLVTIVAAVLIGLSLHAAVEFSFLLGLVTLGAATAYDTLKHGHEIVATFGLASPVIGFVAAFLAAIVAVRWMVSYLQTHSLAIFGWYRIGLAFGTIGLLVTGRI